MMLPENVSYYDELDKEYAKDLKRVTNNLQFYSFKKRWAYWLNEEAQELSCFDWVWISPLLEECREANCCPTEKHRAAWNLAIPERIMYVSLVAKKWNIPWGATYLRLKERGIISY